VKKVIGVFMEPQQAELAASEIIDAGINTDNISVLAQRGVVEEVVDEDKEETALESAGAGAVGGTAVGGLIGLIAGASALLIPGLGPMLAAGTWASVLGTAAAGAGVGAAYGGLVGGLVGMGVGEEKTHVYTEGVEKGGVLLLVDPEDPDRIETVENIMIRHDGIGVDVLIQPDES
jgi:hypothetical protein